MRRLIYPITVFLVALVVGTLTSNARRLIFDRSSAEPLTITKSQTAFTRFSNSEIRQHNAAWSTLLSFENQDLSKLDKAQAAKLSEAIDVLVGKRENQFLFPQLITKMSDSIGQERYVLVEESPLTTIPGNSGLSVHVFTLDGSLIRSSVFLTGWRIRLTGIRVAYFPQIGGNLLEVSSEPSINGRDVAKQLYALIDDHVLVIRLEDKRGELIRNVYGAPNHKFGLTLPWRSGDELERALQSKDDAEILATLTWLSGVHLNPKAPEPGYEHEDMAEARLADDVRAREGVKAKLTKLVASKNLWIRQAAKLTSKIEIYN